VTFLAEKLRPPASRCAGGTLVVPAENAEVEKLAVDTLTALNYFGLAEVEILYDPATRRSFVVEVNARPWLQCSLPATCGCDLLGHVLGSTHGPEPNIDRNHAWLYFWPDLRVCFSPQDGIVRSGDLSMASYLRSVLAADVFPVWSWRDPLPILNSMAARIVARLRTPSAA
jgi:predicted ATP-grasp superfamily ATP-dependent carboligase